LRYVDWHEQDSLPDFAGVSFGRTPLIQLSPKKTWEGFIGGALGTMAAAVAMTWAFGQFPWMYCPREELAFGPLACSVPQPFVPRQFYLTDLWHILPDFVLEDVRPLINLLPQSIQKSTARIVWTCMPAQMHAMVLATFASLVGPFGAPPM
jgi:phosphatidate cytidylyltransferase